MRKEGKLKNKEGFILIRSLPGKTEDIDVEEGGKKRDKVVRHRE